MGKANISEDRIYANLCPTTFFWIMGIFRGYKGIRMAGKINILKRLDLLFGASLVHVARLFVPARKDLSGVGRFLFIRPGGIGDAVLLIPAIKAVKNKYPDAHISVLAERRNSAVFSMCPDVKNVYNYDRPKELWKVIRDKYDTVIDTEQWHRLSSVVARLTRAPILIGYATNEREKLFTHPIAYSHEDYEVRSFLNLLSPLIGEVSFDADIPFLSVPSGTTERVRPLLQPLSGRKIVTIFPGGSIPEKRWGAERFSEVVEMLAEKGYGIVVIGGKEEIREGGEISSGLSGVIDLCGKLSLVETSAILKEAQLLITGDSGIMHIAYGLGVKTLSLFGPGIEKKWAPRGEKHLVINKTLDCGPCTKFGNTPKCKNNSECMKRITVDEVYESSIELLEWGQGESKKM